MKRNNKFFSMLYVVLCLAFFYLPILVTMIFSFNSSKSLTDLQAFPCAGIRNFSVTGK